MDRFHRQGDEARRSFCDRERRRPIPRDDYERRDGKLFERGDDGNPDRSDFQSGREEFTAGYGEATFDPRDSARLYDPRRDASYLESFSDAHPLQRERGGFGGRGPKGYQRSDERIHEDLCDALAADLEVDARAIEVTVQQGEVTLEGTVPVRAMKRAAEDLAAGISGARDVRNSLRVRRHFERREVP